MTAPRDERISPLQVKELVYDKLWTAIVDDEFAPGEPLRENALSDRFGVSKTPIREALVRLEREGLVEVAPFRGARVKAYTEHDLHEIYEVREILEAECVRRAAAPGDPTPARLSANVDEAERALEAGDLAATAAALDAYDDILFGLLENSFLDDVLRRLGAHLRRISQVAGGVERYRASIAEHRAIVAELERGDAAAAQALLRDHLRSVRDAQMRDLASSSAAPM